MAPVIKLNSGYDMPQVGFGLWKVDNAVASDVVYNAIKAGYRLFDGACGKSHLPALHPPYHRPAGNGCAGFTMTLEHALLNAEGKEGQGETTPPPPSFSTPHADGGVEFCRTLAGSASGTGGGSVWDCAKGHSHLHKHTRGGETTADLSINRLRQRG